MLFVTLARQKRNRFRGSIISTNCYSVKIRRVNLSDRKTKLVLSKSKNKTGYLPLLIRLIKRQFEQRIQRPTKSTKATFLSSEKAVGRRQSNLTKLEATDEQTPRGFILLGSRIV